MSSYKQPAGDGGSVEFFSTSGNHFVKRVPEQTAISRTRTTKTGKTVHEELYKSLTGVLRKAETRENEYGKEWVITLEHDEGKCVIQMQHGGRHIEAFAKRLEGVASGVPVTLAPYNIEDAATGKTNTGINILQNGQKLPNLYTKDSGRSLPAMKKVRVNGKDVWDKEDYTAALDKLVTDWFAFVPPPAAGASPAEPVGGEAPF
jgi:hypothetical protein